MKQTKHILNIVFLFSLIFGMNSCQNAINDSSKEHPNKMKYPDFQERNTGLGNCLKNQDTLIITVEFSDCGEWGGHIETLSLTRNSNNKITGQLLIDSVSCENIKEFASYSAIDDNTRVIIKSLETELGEADEKLINLFMHRIIELYLNQKFDIRIDSNGEEVIPISKYSGTIIKIRNTNSTLMVNYWNIGSNKNTWYGKVRKEIFEKENK